jgi:hypothetical protein
MKLTVISPNEVGNPVSDQPIQTVLKISTVGLPGPAGKSFHANTSVPLVDYGNNGDTFLDIYTGDLYEKINNVWTINGTLVSNGGGGGGGGATINDGITSGSFVWSSSKVNTELATKSGTSHTHPDATSSVSGFMTAAEFTKLAGIEAGANLYVHPSGDGNRHVPATGITNNGKFLKSGATAASEAWTTITKTDVGLANVDNTADSAKPISTATQTALNAKPNVADGSSSSTSNTWSIDQIKTYALSIKTDLQNGAGPALDTLSELAAAIGNDPSYASTIATSLGLRVRVDASQSFNSTQQGQARTNIAAVGTSDVGDTTTNFVTIFEAGLV